jgi:hypothetical protein
MLPHITAVITAGTARTFKPMIIVPELKKAGKLAKFADEWVLASSPTGWITSDLWEYNCFLFVSELSLYRLHFARKHQVATRYSHFGRSFDQAWILCRMDSVDFWVGSASYCGALFAPHVRIRCGTGLPTQDGLQRTFGHPR